MRRTTEGAAPCQHAIPTTRLRWFTGRFMTARDLTDEQEYHLRRHRLHNRLLHGWGTVCGLEVHPNDRPDCEHEWVWVDAGIAIDCLGREITLPKRDAARWPVDPSRTSSEDALAILCIRYRECHAEPLPAIVADCTDGTATEPGRVVERWEFEVHPVTDTDDCWSRLLHGDADHDPTCRDECDDPAPCRDGCLEPVCELGECVPIALLSRHRGEAIRVDVDQHGERHNVRRSLPPPATYLTHVVSASWRHGSDLAFDDLQAAGGELRVRFDRDLADGESSGIGVNEFTFLVEIEDSTGSRERLEFDPDHPPRVENGCEAVFTIHPDRFDGPKGRRGARKLVNDTVFVTVNGDLIHDCHGLPVDADFFGTWPSGDGIKGGVLRSWFFVSDRKEAGP
jgi:hypothetical protein